MATNFQKQWCMRHCYQVQCCYMLRTLKPFFDAEICSTVRYLPNARIDLPNVFKSHPSTSSDRCGRNPVQAYVAVLSTILPNFSIKPTPRMCMSASVDMPSKFLVWQNTPALDEFTSLEHQLHSLNDWSNQVSIKLWLISLPAFAFVF